MNRLFRKTVCCLCTCLFAVALWGCNGKTQGAEEPKTPPIDKSAFHYQALSFPEELASAYHVYLCYQDETHTLLSVCSRNGALFGPMQKTDYLALCDLEGGMVSFPVETDAYIISAVPYKGGVLYVDYTQPDSGIVWSLIQKDGTVETVLDTGTADAYDQTPLLFYVQDVPYYLCMNEDGFSIKKIVGQAVVTVHSETGCDLGGIVMVFSNGKHYCFMVKYPDEDLCRFYICDADGVKYRHKLSGKIASFTITDRYAICGTGMETTQKHSIETVDLATGDAKVYALPSGPLYNYSGTGSICVCNDNRWQPWAIDIENETVFTFSAPRSSQGDGPLHFYPAGKNRFFVINQNDDVYRFYLLHILT